MKELSCGAVVPDCGAAFFAETEEDLLGQVAVHARDLGGPEVRVHPLDGPGGSVRPGGKTGGVSFSGRRGADAVRRMARRIGRASLVERPGAVEGPDPRDDAGRPEGANGSEAAEVARLRSDLRAELARLADGRSGPAGPPG